MGVQQPNSTNYQHPNEPNLLNLHKAMQYSGTGEPVIRTQPSNSFGTDLFGRLKTSDPLTLFDSSNRFKLSGDFTAVTAVNATVTHDANSSSALLNVTNDSGSKVYFETRRVFPYQPGKSLQVLMTFVFAEPQENLRQRAGYFSANNGVFIEVDDFDVYLVKRSYSSGVLSEERVLQSDWNLDKLDGTGNSNIELDLSKAQIFWQEYEWLGVGSVRCGFAINGTFIPIHQFDHANIITSTYMTTASLPLRLEIENTAATDVGCSLKQICATVISNGGYNRQTEQWSIVRSTGVSINSTSFIPLVSIRMASGRTDSVIIPDSVNLAALGNNFVGEWALIKNAATLTGVDWVNHSPSTGNVDYDISATAMTGGVVVRSGLLQSTTQASGKIEIDEVPRFDLQLGRTQAGVSDTITLAFRALASSATAYSSLAWVDLI